MAFPPEQQPAPDPRAHAHVQLDNIRKQYAEVTAVHDLSLAVAKGEFFSLLGPSGCGKTTTLRLIAGLDRLNHGTIAIDERLVASTTYFIPPEKRGVGVVFQDYALFPHMTVFDNIAFGLHGWSRAAVNQRVAELLGLVGLGGAGRKYPHELSGGQRQRVALARSLAPSPSVMLLDEPFSNLDAELRAALRRETKEILKANGTTVILVTHDQEEALSLAERVAVMAQGRVLQTATPEELYWRPSDRAVAAFVGEANFLPGEARWGTAVCELGALPASGAPDGRVEVMVRPELLVPVADEVGPGRVVGREFYGPDQAVAVVLDTGTTLRCRLGAEPAPPLGSRVRLEVRGAPVVFPLDQGAAAHGSVPPAELPPRAYAVAG